MTQSCSIKDELIRSSVRANCISWSYSTLEATAEGQNIGIVKVNLTHTQSDKGGVRV